MNVVKLFDFESVLAFKIEIVVPSIQKCHLCEKWAWDVSRMVELEAINDKRYNVEQNAAQQPVQGWYQHFDHRVIEEWVDACFVERFR